MKLPRLRPDRGLREALQRFADSTPLLGPAAAFAAGILAGSAAAADWAAVAGWTALAVALAAATVLVAAGRRIRVNAFSAVALAAVFAAGVADTALRNRTVPAATLPEGNETYYATVDRAGENDVFQTLDITVTAIGPDRTTDSAGFRARLRVNSFEQSYEPGQAIVFNAKMRRILDLTDSDEERSPARALLRQGIAFEAAVGAAPEPDSIASGGRPALAGLKDRFVAIGRGWRDAIAGSDMSATARHYLAALLTGDRQSLDAPQRQLFSRAGVAHLLALSGTHAGIIAMIVTWALFPLAFFGLGRWRMAMVMAAVWFYALCTGSQPSVVRAATMLSVFLGARLLQRPSSGANSLMLAALVILAVTPADLFDLGFQLSFASVASIIAFAQPLNPVKKKRYKVAYFICSGLSVSLAATLGTSMIAALRFHFFPVYFLLSNSLIGVILPLAIGSGILWLGASACGLPTALPAAAADFFCGASDSIIAFIASLPGSTIDGIYFPALTIVPWVGALIALRFYFTSRRRRHAAAATLLTVATAATALQPAIAHAAADEWFVNRSAENPQIMISRNGALEIFAPWAGSNHEALMEQAAVTYADYIGRRRLSGPTVNSGTERIADGKARKGLIEIDGLRIFIVGARTREADLPDRVDWLIFGPRTKLTPTLATEITRCDTIAHFGSRDPAVGRFPSVDLTQEPLRRPIAHSSP